MYLQILKDRRFWLGWSILSIMSGVIAYIIIKSKEADLTKDKIYYATEFRHYLKHSSIIAVQSPRDTADYIRYFRNETENVVFKFTNISEGTKLYILNLNKSGNLAKIAIKESSADRVNGGYNEYWIWHEFLSSSKE